MRTRPLLVFDGDCGFCTTSVTFLEKHLDPDADVVAWQFTDLDALGTTAERAAHELLWIRPDGRIFGGAQAVAALLRAQGRFWWPVGGVLAVPPVRWLAHGLYRLIANNRHRLPGGTPLCAIRR
ncbi:hypothetical protein GCM10027589_17030 [Actinocorallia lasiicapitis]